MPTLVLSGYIHTPQGPEAFEVYRCNGRDGDTFTMVDQQSTERGWVTLNSDGGLPSFASRYKFYYASLDDYQRGEVRKLPTTELENETDEDS